MELPFEKEQSAVEYLHQRHLYITWLRNRDEISEGTADRLRTEALEKANEMFRQQIIKAHSNGYIDSLSSNDYFEKHYATI